MALNETYEREIEIPVQLVDIPKNVVLTSDTTTNVRVTVRDKGFSLLAYLYGNKTHTIKIKFNAYAKKTGVGVVSSSELQKMIFRQLFNSSQIVSVKPDKFEYFFNYGLKKRVPVRLNGRIIPRQSYYLSRTYFTPDSIEIYASREMLDSIKYVNTELLNIKNLTDTSYLFYGGETPVEHKSNFVVEVMRKDGSTYTLFPIEGFRWRVPGTPRVIFIHLLESHDSTSYKVGLFRVGPELDGSYWGIIENNEEIMEQIAKVRIRMKDFRADNLVLLKPYSEDCLISWASRIV